MVPHRSEAPRPSLQGEEQGRTGEQLFQFPHGLCHDVLLGAIDPLLGGGKHQLQHGPVRVTVLSAGGRHVLQQQRTRFNTEAAFAGDCHSKPNLCMSPAQAAQHSSRGAELITPSPNRSSCWTSAALAE